MDPMKKSSITYFLETLAAWHFLFCFFCTPIFCPTLAFWLCFTRAWPLMVLYLIWYIYDRETPSRGGRRSHFVSHFSVWKYFSAYFPFKLVKTHDLDPNKNYLFACHPHGIVGMSFVANFAPEGTSFSSVFPNMASHMMVLPNCFRLPFFREYCIASGACSCLRESLEYVLTKPSGGNVAALVVGGAFEAFYAKPGDFTLNLANRKGFIKSALRSGASLVPVYFFGENNLYSQSTRPTLVKLQKWLLDRFGIILPLPYAVCWVLPYRIPVFCIVGKPIHVVRNEFPSQREIDDLHRVYVEKLNELFEEHKQLYGVPQDMHLKIA